MDVDDGQLQVIIGPMFSGKTSELIRRIQRFHLACYRCLIIKHTFDNKVSTTSTVPIESHDGNSLPAILASNLKDVDKFIQDFEVIGIDEGHLFSDLDGFCEKNCDDGKTVIVSGLDSRESETFPQILRLIPLAESVTKLTSICMACADEAPFTKSIPPEKLVSEQKRYMSLCGHCFEHPYQNLMSPFKNYIKHSS